MKRFLWVLIFLLSFFCANSVASEDPKLVRYFKDYRIDELTLVPFLYSEIALHDIGGHYQSTWELLKNSIKRVVSFDPNGKSLYYQVSFDAKNRPVKLIRYGAPGSLECAFHYPDSPRPTKFPDEIILKKSRLDTPGKRSEIKKINRKEDGLVFYIQVYVDGSLSHAENYIQKKNLTTITSYSPEGRLRQIRLYQLEPTKEKSRLFYKEKNYSEHGESFISTADKEANTPSKLSDAQTFSWVNDLTYDQWKAIDVEKIYENNQDIGNGFVLVRTTGLTPHCDLLKENVRTFSLSLEKKSSSAEKKLNEIKVFDGFDLWEDFSVTRYDEDNLNLQKTDWIRNGLLFESTWRNLQLTNVSVSIKHEYYPNRRPFREWVYFDGKLNSQDLFHSEDQVSRSKLEAPLQNTPQKELEQLLMTTQHPTNAFFFKRS